MGYKEHQENVGNFNFLSSSHFGVVIETSGFTLSEAKTIN